MSFLTNLKIIMEIDLYLLVVVWGFFPRMLGFRDNIDFLAPFRASRQWVSPYRCHVQ